MSRSKRKSPYIGFTCAKSEKEDKQIAHRIERRIVKRRLHGDIEDAVMPHKREVSNVFNWSKDGRQRIHPKSKWMRK